MLQFYRSVKVLKTLKNDIELEQISLNENTKTLAFIYYNQNKLNLHFIDGKFTEGLPFVSKLLVEIENYKDQYKNKHVCADTRK